MNAVMAQNWDKKAAVPVDLAFPVVVASGQNIHVIGGGGPAGASNLHLRYRADTDRWDTLPPVTYLAQQPAGALLNGKIHVFGGGYPNTGTRLDKHVYYDLDSGKWFPAAKLPSAIAIHKAVSYNGKIYVMGGQPDKLLFQEFDPGTNTWTRKSDLPDQNFWYGAITANANGMYRFGGGGFGAPVKSAHYFQAKSDQWIAIPPLPVALHAASAVALNDSLIFISGGYSDGITHDKTYIYHTRKQLYYPSNVLPFGTNYHSTVLSAGCIYSIGGDNSSVLGAGVSLIRLCSPEYKWAVSVAPVRTNRPYELAVTPEGICIRLALWEPKEPVRFEIMELNGKVIAGGNMDKPVHYCSVSGFKPGIYLLKLTGYNRHFMEKIIVH